MKYKSVTPAGILSVPNGDSWYLIHPEPIAKDSWENDSCFRWLVVDENPFDELDNGTEVYNEAYHVVIHGMWYITYPSLDPIVIGVKDVDDVNQELAKYDRHE